jgi:hypothetical protein
MECIVRQIAKKKKKITPLYLDMMISNMKVTWKFQIVKFIFWVCSFSLSFFLVFHVFYLGSFASLLSLLFFFCLSHPLMRGLSLAFIKPENAIRSPSNMKRTLRTITIVMEMHRGAQGDFSSSWFGLLKKMNNVF